MPEKPHQSRPESFVHTLEDAILWFLNLDASDGDSNYSASEIEQALDQVVGNEDWYDSDEVQVALNQLVAQKRVSTFAARTESGITILYSATKK